MIVDLKCRICGKECVNANGLASHINRKNKNINDPHYKWSVEKYIDTFLREDTDICLCCHNPLPLKLSGKHLTYCSISCKMKNELNEKVKNGIPIAMQNKNALEKAKVSRRKKYNGKWCSEEGQINWNASAWSEEAIKNRTKTFNEHYGCNYPFQNKDYFDAFQDRLEEKHGVRNPFQSQEIMRKTKKKYEYEGITFDSSWELAYYIFLRDFKIDFIYHPKEVPFEYNNETHYTFIDFLVEGKYVEIKGDHLRNEDGTMKNLYGIDQSFMMAKQKKYDELNVNMMSWKEIKPYIKYVKLNYGFNFLKEHRKYTTNE